MCATQGERHHFHITGKIAHEIVFTCQRCGELVLVSGKTFWLGFRYDIF